mmetsp:Transcript_123734/g.344396  ORF Transcript_123734/g.344396 Transcript_123734/m.344396 type:complete len:220 (-) Transcript_123734:47-706(-)
MSARHLVDSCPRRRRRGELVPTSTGFFWRHLHGGRWAEDEDLEPRRRKRNLEAVHQLRIRSCNCASADKHCIHLMRLTRAQDQRHISVAAIRGNHHDFLGTAGARVPRHQHELGAAGQHFRMVFARPALFNGADRPDGAACSLRFVGDQDPAEVSVPGRVLPKVVPQGMIGSAPQNRLQLGAPCLCKAGISQSLPVLKHPLPRMQLLDLRTLVDVPGKR